MKTRSVLLGLMAATLATGALAQTTPSNSSSSSTPSSSQSSAPSSSTAPAPSNGGADQSAGAKEQQSQKQPCTGNDHSNVNCKQKQGRNPNDTSTTPK